MDPFQLTGRTASHVTPHGSDSARMHPQVLSAFNQMQQAAMADGIRISAVSAFRDFTRQVVIWNRKWNGERPLHDRQGQPVAHAALSPHELLHTILTWSALPGASRHHWGTDLDVIDSAACPDDYTVQLLPREYLPGGPFHHLHSWLENRAADFGFFFPYKTDRNGVSPEPWHISYAPIAVPALRKLTPELLHEALEHTDLAGKEIALERLPEIFERYILAIDPPRHG